MAWTFQKRKNQETQARQSECLATSCVDNAVKAMKLLKDKVLNSEKQEKRIAKKSNIGSKKSDKQDDFKPTLQRLSDAAGGIGRNWPINRSAVCLGHDIEAI